MTGARWYGVVKRLALRWLPHPALQLAKRVHYARRLRSPQRGSEHDLVVVERLVAAGDAVVDVGANIGVYTIALARRVGPVGRVYALEPVPPTFEILSSNVRRLAAGNVTVWNRAASDSERVVRMQVPAYPEGGDNYYESRITDRPTGGATDRRDGPSAGRWYEVEAARLDALLGGLERPVRFVKIDVEGHELAVLRGAAALLRRDRPALLVEVSGDPDAEGGAAHELFALLASLGYGAWWFDGANLARRRPGDRSTNWFFLTDAHAHAVAGLVEAVPAPGAPAPPQVLPA